MKKYIIMWDCGYGKNYEAIEADSIEEAQKEAYEQWREEAESNADYDAEEYTEELAEDLGL